MARLIKINDPNRTVYELETDVFKIGRLPENHLVLTDALASRRHAEIRKVGVGYRVVDLKSLNGIYVNNLKVEDEPLAHGDLIAIGEAKLIFEDVGAMARGAAASPLPPTIGDPDVAAGKPAEPAEAVSSPISLHGMAGREIVKPLSDSAHFDLEVLATNELLEPERQEHRVKQRESTGSRSFFTLYQVARALNSINRLSDLLDLTMRLVLQVVNAERGVIFLYNDQGELEPALARSKTGGELPALNISKTITQRAVEQRSGIITADACYDPRFREGASIIAYNIRSALCVPLWDRDKARGAIYLDNLMEAYAFTEEDLDLMTAIANQVAIAAQREEMQTKMQEAAILRANLERFHSPDVVNHIMQRSKTEEFQRRLEEREVTILFSDIVNFTPLMEKTEIAMVADILKRYLDEMTEIVFQHSGSIDKFIGDAIMAIFGAPISHGNDAELAIYSAIEMQHRMKEFKESLDPTHRFDVRIGVNTGIVAAGYMGSRKRIEYTVLGDPVNIASRLEHAATPGGILVGEATFAKVSGLFKFKDRGSTLLKGKKLETRIYEVIF